MATHLKRKEQSQDNGNENQMSRESIMTRGSSFLFTWGNLCCCSDHSSCSLHHHHHLHRTFTLGLRLRQSFCYLWMRVIGRFVLWNVHYRIAREREEEEGEKNYARWKFNGIPTKHFLLACASYHSMITSWLLHCNCPLIRWADRICDKVPQHVKYAIYQFYHKIAMLSHTSLWTAFNK